MRSLEYIDRIRHLGEKTQAARRINNIEAADQYAKELILMLEKNNLLPYGSKAFPIHSGRMNFLAIQYQARGEIRFLKISPIGLERNFYTAIQNKIIPSEGKLYLIPRPYEIICLDGLMFLYLEFFESFDSKSADPETTTLRIRALAEYSAENMVDKKHDRVAGIPPHRLRLKDDRLLHAIEYAADGSSVDSKERTQERIMSGWGEVVSILKLAPVSLAVRDAGKGNTPRFGEKIILMDNGATHYAPLGFDLGVILAREKAITFDDAVTCYAEELERAGIQMPSNILHFIACCSFVITTLSLFYASLPQRKVREAIQLAITLIDRVRLEGGRENLISDIEAIRVGCET